MNMFGTLANTPSTSTIITRSDHMPTALERYGEWARKYYGNGCNRWHNDSRESLDYVAHVAAAAVVFAH